MKRMRDRNSRSARSGHAIAPLLGGALALALALASTAGVSLAAASSHATALPASPTYLGATAAQGGLAVRPATIAFTGDGTGFLGGANARAKHGSIAWTQWNARVARGTGFDQLNDCKPYCAAGKYHGYRVRIVQWRPRKLAHQLVFTRMTIYFEKHAPRGEPRHYTFTDMHVRGGSGGFGWGPPGALGYCVHTHGLRPAAGCENIHELPHGRR